MSTTKTVSTRIDNEVHTLFNDYCNQQGKTMSQMLNQFVNDVVSQNKDSIDSSECSIGCDEEIESKKSVNFSQDEKNKELLQQTMRILDRKQAQKIIQTVDSSFREMIDEIKSDIDDLITQYEKKVKEERMKKEMNCSNFTIS